MISVRAKFSFALLMAITLVSVSSVNVAIAQVPQSDIYFAKEIWTGKGAPISDGGLVVVDGRVSQVGPRADLSIPPGAEIHELGSRIIIPGLVVSQTSLSGKTDEERTLTPEINALDGFDFFADRSALLKSGVTTIQVSPGESRLMPGIGGVVQLAGNDLNDRVLSNQESLRIVLSDSSRKPPRIFEPEVGPVSEDRPLMTTRPQLATLSASLAGLRQIFKQATANETFVSDAEADEMVASVSAMIQSKTPIRITAVTAPEIRGAISLAKEFDLKVLLVDCGGLEPFQTAFETWKPYVKGVILAGDSPGKITNPTPEQIEDQKQPWEYARELMDAGIPVAIRPRTDEDLEHFMFVAGQFLQDDLTPEELLAAITSEPARLMGVEKQVGSLEKGKRADFVVLNNRPFQLHSRISATYMSGDAKFEKKREMLTTVVKADRVYVGEGRYLDDASVVVKGKTVRGVGSSVSAPVDADVKTFEGAVIVPGFVDLGAGLGLGGPLQGSVTLQTKLGDQLYADDPAIQYARRNGITTALLGGTVTSQPSPVVAFKLGPDARVISDPIAVRFKLTGDTAAGITTNEKSLKAGKAYADSWIKYEKDLAAYEAKLKEQGTAKKPPTAEAQPTKTAAKTKVDDKGNPDSGDKKEADKKEADKKDADKKESDKKKTDEKKPSKKPLPDPITGTWEGELVSERLPEPARAFKFELVLEGENVTGSIEMLRQTLEIEKGTFDRESRKLNMTISLRGSEVEIIGELDEAGAFSGSIELGRMGTLEMKATRTEDKSKKPEPEKEQTPEKKDKPDEKKDEKKDKPEPDKDKPTGGKPADKDKPETKDEKKPESQVVDKTETKKTTDAAKTAETQPELKEPKKPKKSDSLEPYRALFARKIPAFVESRDLNSIKATAELFSKKYKLRTVIVGADDLAREPGLLAGYDVSVCTGPGFSVTIDKNPPTNLPQLLSNERLRFGFQSSGTTGSGKLLSAVQYVVNQGLSSTDAIDALTASPARMLSKDLGFGSLASGKDADLVVLSGPPFEFSTKILAVMIDGVWVYDREEQQ